LRAADVREAERRLTEILIAEEAGVTPEPEEMLYWMRKLNEGVEELVGRLLRPNH